MNEVKTELRTKDIIKKFESLNKEVAKLKHKIDSDEISKSTDRTYSSINNIRAFLQILAIIMTIFLAGAVSFSFFSLKNIFSIYENAKQVKDMKYTIDQHMDSASNMETKILNTSNYIDSTLTLYLTSFKNSEDIIRNKINTFDDSFSKTVEKLQKHSMEEMNKLELEVNNKIEISEQRINKIQDDLNNISEIFNDIGIKHENKLNAREKQLLTLLAMEIDPNNPAFNFNYATWAMSFGRYEDALSAINKTLDDQTLDSDVLERASVIRDECEKYIKDPPKVEQPDPEGVAIGDYVIMYLHINTLRTLVEKGLISYEEVLNILNSSKMKK